MLSLLHIENIALIESADIHFGAGFNVLTGETGAGKSIVIDSISAVLGERTSRDLIRTGVKTAYVSAIFTNLPQLRWFEENGIIPDENGELLLERTIYSDGKNACKVNGRPLTVANLKVLGQQLLNIHGQHDGQQLLDDTCHIGYLDRFGSLQDLLEAYQAPFNEVTRIMKEIAALQMDDAEKSRRIDTLTYQINELERAKLKPGEDDELSAKKTMLRNAGKLISALEEAEFALDGGGEQDGAVSLLSSASDAIQHAARCIDEGSTQAAKLAELAERLSQMRYDAFDVLESARDLRLEIDVSSDDIDAMESRLDQLYRLEKKYGSTVEDMLLYLDQCKAELEQIQYSSDRIGQLEKELQKVKQKAILQGGILTEARKKTALILQDRIQKELTDLDMPKVRFEVEILPKRENGGMDATGLDQVRFLMSANIGEDMKPISKIASGGELARIMLALKNVLAESDDIATLVFDEVDTGVSGRAAVKVGRKMADIADQKQVLCVTHLPQIAAMADVHFYVEKGESGGRTFTNVAELSRERRSVEISRLIGGEHVSTAIIAGAEELLVEAEQYKARVKHST